MGGCRARLRAVPVVLSIIMSLGWRADARNMIKKAPSKKLAKPDFTVYHTLCVPASPHLRLLPHQHLTNRLPPPQLLSQRRGVL